MSIGKSAWHFARYFTGFDTPQTQVTPCEQEVLRKYAAGKSRLAEIGVFEGYTTCRLAEAMAEDGELFAIDPFFRGRLGISWGKWIAHRELARLARQKKIHFVEAFSHDAARELAGQFDFIFVDGDHSIEAIKRDWNDWSRRLIRGGIIALHDSIVPAHNTAFTELGSCVFFQSHIQHDPEFEIVEQADSLSILRRRI